MFSRLAILVLLLAYVAHPAAVQRRWYGVQPLKNDKPEGQYGPWPTVSADHHGGMQPVRYCFANARSQKNLQSVISQVVEM